jgi:hypothetical protein
VKAAPPTKTVREERRTTPAVERPAQSPAAQPAAAAPVVQAAPTEPASPPAPSRAQVQEAREEFAMLHSRATGIRTTLDSLQKSQAASGLNMSSRIQQPAHLMDTYLEGANAALNAGDIPAANDFIKKAERQIEILEKLLNR